MDGGVKEPQLSSLSDKGVGGSKRNFTEELHEAADTDRGSISTTTACNKKQKQVGFVSQNKSAASSLTLHHNNSDNIKSSKARNKRKMIAASALASTGKESPSSSTPTSSPPRKTPKIEPTSNSIHTEAPSKSSLSPSAMSRDDGTHQQNHPSVTNQRKDDEGHGNNCIDRKTRMEEDQPQHLLESTVDCNIKNNKSDSNKEIEGPENTRGRTISNSFVADSSEDVVSQAAAPPSPPQPLATQPTRTSNHQYHNHSICMATAISAGTTLKRRRPRLQKRICTGCSNIENPEAIVWCCDCHQCLCLICDERKHDSDALDSKLRPMASHRVEYINPNDIPLLTSLLELIICCLVTIIFPCLFFSNYRNHFVAAIMHLFGADLVGLGRLGAHSITVTAEDLEDYFYSSICPVTEKIRRWIFRLDHALLPVVKGQLGNWCDIEDSFWKMFSDLWIRGVLTQTDSYTLIIMKIPSGLNALVVMLVLVPILLGLPFAIIATIVRILEMILIPNWRLIYYPTRMIQFLNWIICTPYKIAISFCLGSVIGLLFVDNHDDSSNSNNSDSASLFSLPQQQRSLMVLPPKTGHRKRPIPSHGICDIWIPGSVSRITRIFRYFHRKAYRVIFRTILSSVFVTFVLRIIMLTSVPRMISKYWANVVAWISKTVNGNSLLNSLNEKIEHQIMLLSNSTSVENFLLIWNDVFHRPHAKNQNNMENQMLHDMIRRMQESTEDDFLEDGLRRLCYAGYKRFHKHFSARVRWSIIGSVALVLLCAGWIRYILVWWDWKRRNRYRRRYDNASK